MQLLHLQLRELHWRKGQKHSKPEDWDINGEPVSYTYNKECLLMKSQWYRHLNEMCVMMSVDIAVEIE